MMQQMFLGLGGGPTGPGEVSAVWNGNNDGYSGAGRYSTRTCRGTYYGTINARPPNQSQVDSQMSAWMNCKSYSGDGVNPNQSGWPIFWGKRGNSLVFTLSNYAANQELGVFIFTNGSRPIIFSGLLSYTDTNTNYGYRYFNVGANGGRTLTCAFDATGDPPYVYWVGPRYDDPGYF